MRCPICDSDMADQTGRRGAFARCPTCTLTVNLHQENPMPDFSAAVRAIATLGSFDVFVVPASGLSMPIEIPNGGYVRLHLPVNNPGIEFRIEDGAIRAALSFAGQRSTVVLPLDSVCAVGQGNRFWTREALVPPGLRAVLEAAKEQKTAREITMHVRAAQRGWRVINGGANAAEEQE
jgi:hypothetical protein